MSKNIELLNLLIKSVDDIKQKVDSIDGRLQSVERKLSLEEGRRSGLLTVKDIVIVLCAVGALVFSFIRAM